MVATAGEGVGANEASPSTRQERIHSGPLIAVIHHNEFSLVTVMGKSQAGNVLTERHQQWQPPGLPLRMLQVACTAESDMDGRAQVSLHLAAAWCG